MSNEIEGDVKILPTNLLLAISHKNLI